MSRRKTQNAIFNADGSRFAITSDPQTVSDYLNQFNALRFIQATDATGATLFIGDDGKPTTVDNGKPFVSARPRSGYTQYFNNDGFTDPISPDNLSPQGVGKLLAKLLEVATTLIAAGGPNGTEMKSVIDGVLSFYNTTAPSFVAAKANISAVDAALTVLTKANGGDAVAAQAKLAAFLGSKGIDAPAPAETPAPNAEVPTATVVTDANPCTLVNVAEVDSASNDGTISGDSEISEPTPAAV